LRSFTITAFFPEVRPAHEAWQSCEARGSEMHIAAQRGLAELRARPKLRGKRIREVRLTIKEIDDSSPANTAE